MVNRSLSLRLPHSPMTKKRALDLLLLAALAVPALLVVVAAALIILIAGHAPFYRSKRLMNGSTPFPMWKLRTLTERQSRLPNMPIFSPSAARRTTSVGWYLRRSRLDELPQFLNVLFNQMSFVGPRPVSPEIVAVDPRFFTSKTGIKPGITGLATVLLCGREERILLGCSSDFQASQVYRRRCIGIKSRIDKIYARNQSLGLDAYVLYLTIARYIPLPGRRAKRLWRDACHARRCAWDAKRDQPVHPKSVAVPA